MQDQNFRTKDGSKYLAERGVSASPRYLEKCRSRGTEDGRDRGPDFYRDERGICWYSRSALDQYAAQRLAARQFRAPARQPENFLATRKKAEPAAA
jgi:hypothetical protein